MERFLLECREAGKVFFLECGEAGKVFFWNAEKEKGFLLVFGERVDRRIGLCAVLCVQHRHTLSEMVPFFLF